eukprot:CAMPEP_0175273744 /NCGR_PEP_ID=MMETSP0093-20121207/47106_1 /TAXON_ID=311494 /ORGANISM="Alexandrium monilatum, Strain CCMP3105" /LENGTH=176 /DNA_ID=CAMNT_0016568589 /DNA_START=297 /DNA_END=827 /DNA_ORIENTATION=+
MQPLWQCLYAAEAAHCLWGWLLHALARHIRPQSMHASTLPGCPARQCPHPATATLLHLRYLPQAASKAFTFACFALACFTCRGLGCFEHFSWHARKAGLLPQASPLPWHTCCRHFLPQFMQVSTLSGMVLWHVWQPLMAPGLQAAYLLQSLGAAGGFVAGAAGFAARAAGVTAHFA